MAAWLDLRLGAKPPSSPCPVAKPSSPRIFLRAWNTSAPARSASPKDSTPTGMTMNSWKSVESWACLPPLRMLNIGTGRTRAPTPPIQR